MSLSLIEGTNYYHIRNKDIYDRYLYIRNYGDNIFDWFTSSPAPYLSAWEIIPCDEYQLLDVTYDFLANDKFAMEPRRVIYRGFRNSTTDIPQDRTIEVSETLSNTSSFQKVEGLTVTITMTQNFNVGLPKIFNGGLNVEEKTAAEWKMTTTESTSKEFKILERFSHQVPPGRAIDARLVWSEYEMDITYIAKLRSKRDGKILYLPGRWKGIRVDDCRIEVFDRDTEDMIETKNIYIN